MKLLCLLVPPFPLILWIIGFIFHLFWFTMRKPAFCKQKVAKSTENLSDYIVEPWKYKVVLEIIRWCWNMERWCFTTLKWSMENPGLEDRWGPHTCDLMAVDSNAMLGSGGMPLRHFTLFPTPESAGTNIFCQDVQLEINPYVFPPIAIIPAVLAYLKGKHVTNCTVVLLVTRVLPSWYTMVLHSKQDVLLLARKGDTRVLWYPTKRGWVLDQCGLQWDLWAFRLQPWEHSSSQNNVCDDSGNKHQI